MTMDKTKRASHSDACAPTNQLWLLIIIFVHH